MKLVKNAAGRFVPIEVNGEPQIPFKGVDKYKPSGVKAKPPIRSCIDYPSDGNKVFKDLKTALKKAGLKDGMTISTHHHLRNGDAVTNLLYDTVKEMGVKNIRWFPSASFPVHSHLIKYLEDGTIHHIEGSMNGTPKSIRRWVKAAAWIAWVNSLFFSILYYVSTLNQSLDVFVEYPVLLVFNLPFRTEFYVYLANACAVLTIIQASFTILAWKGKQRSLAERIYYSLATLAATGYILLLENWGLIAAL